MLNKFEQVVIEQIGIFSLADCGNHGANCGYNGFTYTSDIEETYQECEDEILSILSDSEAPDSEAAYETISQIISYRTLTAAEIVASQLTDGYQLQLDQDSTFDGIRCLDPEDAMEFVRRCLTTLNARDNEPESITDAVDLINDSLPEAYQRWLKLTVDVVDCLPGVDTTEYDFEWEIG